MHELSSRSKTEIQLRAEFDDIKAELAKMVSDVQFQLKIDELQTQNNEKSQNFMTEVLRGEFMEAMA